MTATEIGSIEKTTLRTSPVLIQGIVQKHLHRLEAECDALLNGLPVRLPAGTVVSITAGGSGGNTGRLMSDLVFTGKDGENYKAFCGTQVQFAPVGW